MPDFGWLDKRLDWTPGQPKSDARTLIRAANTADLFTLSKTLKVGRKTIYKWLNYHGWVVRVAVRNQHHLVGIVVSKHGPEANSILRWWFSPVFEKPAFPGKLLAAAALEQPELGCEITVNKDDDKTIQIVEALGWPEVGMDDDTNLYRSKPWEPTGGK